jgi:hypothetical protein
VCSSDLVIHTFYEEAGKKMAQGATLRQVMGIPERVEISRMKEKAEVTLLKDLAGGISSRLTALEVE